MSKRSKKKNKYSFKYVGIIFILIIGVVIYQVYFQQNKLKVILSDKLEAEINSEVKIKDYVKEIKNGELINGEEVIDTSKLGNVKIKLTLKDLDETYDFDIKVIDTEKPIVDGKKEITIYVGRDVNLLDGVTVKDNSLEEIQPKVAGEYDNNKAGTYNLKYQAVDSSGNIGEFDFILYVITDEKNRVFTTSKGYIGKVIDGVTYIDGVLIANKTYDLPSDYGSGLTSETTSAFNKMKEDASKAGYNLYIGSGYRSYSTQKSLYNKYVNRDGKAKADTYSARAGHSEHQTGLAIDVCDRGVSACINSYFDDSNSAKWINENCYKYGFILRYPKSKEDITGYKYESWHLRYVGVDLATKLYTDGNWLTLEEYYGIDSKYAD